MRFQVLSFVLPILLLNLINVSVGQAQLRSRRTYGESCNKTLRCDKKAWLTCIDDICDCMQPAEMMYVPEKLTCVSKSGERCKFQINEGGEDTLAIFEKTDCVENAECGLDGTCACSKNYYENFNGTCSSKAEYNKTCSSDAYCQDHKFLSCIDGLCACNSNRVLSEHGDGVCRGRAGKPLGNTKDCIEEASKDQNGICKCDEIYLRYVGSDGRCLPTKEQGEACFQDEECNYLESTLKCVEGICGCDPKKSQYTNAYGYLMKVKRRLDSYYDISSRAYRIKTINVLVREHGTRQQCVGLAGKNCNSNNNLCVKNADCHYDTCVCLPGYTATSKGTCGIQFGGSCNETEDCSDAFLCTNGKCDCAKPNHQIERNGKCVSITHGTCSEDIDCVENAFCSKYEQSPVKKCQCKDGFVENREGLCDFIFGSKCSFASGSIPCDSIAGLKCRNQQCDCPDADSYFDTEERKCLGLVGTRCSLYNELDEVCVKNAKCSSPTKTSTPTCKCTNGWIEGEGRICEPAVQDNIPQVQLIADNQTQPVTGFPVQAQLPVTVKPVKYSTRRKTLLIERGTEADFTLTTTIEEEDY